MLPSLLLIGTRKGGTTALSNLLKHHPQILMPNCTSGIRSRRLRGMCVWDKEVRYFSRGLPQHADLCWYRSLYSCPPAEHRLPPPSNAGVAEEEESGYVAFDGSPDYLVIPDASVAVMRAQLGAWTRLVVLLRNPSDRFYSAYNMAFNEKALRKQVPRTGSDGGGGGESVPSDPVTYASFAAALPRLLLCAPICPSEPSVVSMFFDYGLYAKHVRKFHAHFGTAALLVERSEDFYQDAASTISRILSFAHLPEPASYSALVQERALSKKARNVGSVWGGSEYTGRLQVAERRKLQAWFAPHNRDFYALIGRDMQWEQEAEKPPSAAPASAAASVEEPKEEQQQATQAEVGPSSSSVATSGGSKSVPFLRPEL